MKRLILILLAAILSAGIVYYNYRTARQEAYLREYQEAVQELVYQRGQLEEQIALLERKQNAAADCAMGILLFEQPNARLMTEVLPVMTEFGLTGAVVFTPETHPGAPDCITSEQMRQLQEAGWGSCAGWDGEGELSDVKAVFAKEKLPVPRSVCVPMGRYRAEQEEALKAAGFHTLFHHGETGSLLSESDGGLRRVGTILWNDPGILTWLDEAVAQKKMLAISVDFSTEYGDFQEDLFRNMCRILQEHTDRFQLANLTDPTEVQERAAAFNQAQRAYLAAEMERIDRQIQRIYALYAQYGAERIVPEG